MQEGCTVMHLSLYREQKACQVALCCCLAVFLGNIAFFRFAGRSLLLFAAYFCSRLLAESTRSGQFRGEYVFSQICTAPAAHAAYCCCFAYAIIKRITA